MKTGTQPTKPLMTARPPVPGRTQEQIMRDLEAVDSLTETPARAAAQTVSEPPEGAGHVTAPGARGHASPIPSLPAKDKHVKNSALMPWELVEGKGTVSFNFKLPNKLGAKLKYLGDTTYGESMTSIVTAAVEQQVEKMLKERGLV